MQCMVLRFKVGRNMAYVCTMLALLRLKSSWANRFSILLDLTDIWVHYGRFTSKSEVDHGMAWSITRSKMDHGAAHITDRSKVANTMHESLVMIRGVSQHMQDDLKIRGGPLHRTGICLDQSCTTA